MSGKKRRTKLRTIRITEELDELLEKDAVGKRMTVNGLLSSILSKYAEWDRYAEKLNHMSISPQFFRSVLDIVDEGKLLELAARQGREAPRQAVPFWFKKLDVETYLAWVSLYSKYGGFAAIEVDSDGQNYTIVARHGLGKAWSKFVKEWLDQSMVSIGITPKVEMAEDSVIVRFTRN